MKIKVNIATVLAVYIVLFCNAGIMNFLKGSTLVTLSVYISLLLWLIVAFINDKTCLKKFLLISFPIIVFWIFLKICSFFIEGEILRTTEHMSKNILFILIFMLMIIYYCVPKRQKSRKLILTVWFFDIIVSSIYTIYRLIENPMLSRILATGHVEEYIGESVSVAGVLGYGSIYGLVLIIIALFGVLKNTKTAQKIVMILCGILFIYTVIQAQFFIAVLITFLGIIINIMCEKKDRKKRYMHLITVLVCVIIGAVIVVKLIPQLINSGALPVMITERLIMFYDQSSMENIFSSNRGIVYLQSINAIRNTYGLGIFFWGGQSAGGHSEILDLIANYGVIFASLFIYGMWRMKKYIYHSIPMNYRHSYNIVWLMFIVFSFLNPSLWCPTTLCLFLIIPLIYLEVQLKHCEGNKSENRINQSWI